MNNTKWIRRFSDLATTVASWSKDPHAQVGAVLTDLHNRSVHLGYNGPATWADDDAIYSLPAEEKNKHIIHAEINAIRSMVRAEFRGEARLYVNKAPCMQCGDKIIYCRNKGIKIKELYIPQLNAESKWYKEQLSSIIHLQNNGVRVYFVAV